jgi:hypothetical protein
MKLLKSIILCGICMMALALTSCDSWLDVNTDPENPSSASATYENRLAHIEFYTNSGTQFAAWRSTMSMGDWTRNYNGSTYWHMSYWNPQQGAVTTAYQWWFVGAACNIQDMYEKAMADEAWHYAGVARVIYAYGFMLMTDLHGEMPFTEALGEDATPSYDNGKTIYIGCLKALDEGLELLSKSQNPALPALSVGDWWCGGDVQKWIKFGNLLKARWINKLNKKGTGSYLDGKYDAQAILDALAKGPQSTADNAIIYHTDDNSTTHDNLGWDEPVDYSPLYSVSGMNSGYMATKMLYDNLTNFGGYGVEDPRADKILPWAYSPNAAEGEYKLKDGWRRTLGVDMVSQASPSLVNGPIRASYSADKKWFIETELPERLGDTVYVEATSSSKGYAANRDIMYRRLNVLTGAAGEDVLTAAESGTYYTRVSSPTYLGTYAEACFIKAEVLFKQGDKNGAFAAYKEGIKSSMEQMNIKLNLWCNEDAGLKACPSFTPMEQADIDNFLANGIGSASDLTLGHILTQKRIALNFSVEIWNDMRRYDFDPELFFGWGIPALHDVNAAALKGIPAGKGFRRWRQCSHEFNYNAANLQEIGHQVPGANMSLPQWNQADDAWTINVWWDSDQE